MPLLGSFSAAHIHQLPLSTPIIPYTTTGDSSYSDPLLCKITIKNRDKTAVLYTHDSFAPSTVNPAIYCSIGLSLSTHGTFDIQIEDSDKTLDTDTIGNGCRVYISVGKTQTGYTLILSGMVRTTGFLRGCENNLLYELSGFGSGIRFNERILDVNKEPSVLDSDGVTLDTSDTNFFADKVVRDTIDRGIYYPKGTLNSKVEGQDGYGYLDADTTEVDSPISDYIPGVFLRFQEIEDLHNQIENYTGGRIYVNQLDKVQLQPIRTPVSFANERIGFMITTSPNLAADDANNTMYPQEDYTWTDSISKDAGYANSLFGILPASTIPDRDTNSDFTSYYENKTVEIAQRFRPITNPNWRLYATVEGVGLKNTQDENVVRGRWRICKDDDGVPMNTNGIVANRYMYPNEKYSTTEDPIQTVEIMGKGNTDLNENSWYWLIFSSVNATATEYWRWYKDNTANSTTATATPGTSDAVNGGTGWTIKNDQERMGLIQGRFKAEPYNILDQSAVSQRILIESVIPSFPQQIKTKQGAVKYMVGMSQTTARPRRVFQFPSLTVPNHAVYPGYTAAIVDSRFNFSTSGYPVVAGQITDISYTFGIKNGGSSPASRNTDLSIQVLGFPQFY